MHFSIPDLQQFHDDNGISYTGYNIYIDGVFHCTARYKQLLSLHEQLQAQNPYLKLPQFPPKKLFLTSSQLEERRILLEKYIQMVGQNPMLANSDLLITFLFSLQQESDSVKMHEVDIEISLMNGYRIPLSVSSTDSSSTILDIACNYINLPKELMKYFSLYLFNWSCAKDGQPSLKKLEEYESPYISQKYVRPEDKIVLRKCYWDPCYDVDLMIDKVSLDLLYLQTIEELDLGWITADAQTKDILASYASKKQKREYMELARTLKHYGRVPAGEAVTDSVNVFGVTGGSGAGGAGDAPCRVRVALASKELTLVSVAQPSREQRYKVTRMRCWRITTLHAIERPQTNGHGPLIDESNKNFELSFEYLISKDNLIWITLRTEHATFISVCLQSIVDELMRQKSGAGPTSPRGKRASLTYLRRDGSSQLITPSSSSDTLSSANEDSYNSGSSREIFSVQKLTEKFASVAFKTGKDCVENNAFEAIGDEEL
ncbi:LOW QUALITY PROTEIN: sorting nexin-17-like [Manduca sexta]|uniref:LOW QUALITY PROTEIN: sorting nexin-17-like n=1 Tax=Manduca sexta TaxID=7130 RepID=UPI00188E0D94|nr:LOW QUALITY PROTEIN: sorting nexin-17-like [Manduca sexta]